MTERAELLAIALDSLPEGLALLDAEGKVMLWNRAAEAVTGYTGAELLSREVPAPLEPLLLACLKPGEREDNVETQPGNSVMVHFQHRLSHELRVMARTLVLRDELGARLGALIAFHPAESLDALPHGECDEDSGMENSQAELEDRLAAAFEDFRQGGEAFGVLWITVDQAQELRKTHGAGACEAMLAKVERAMSNGLRPTEKMGRWGDDEFLVLSHERTPEMLALHAQLLAGLARTADFRWWGDRISLTASIGAAQAKPGKSLAELLDKARTAMLASYHAGGNQVTPAPGGPSCSPS